MMKPQPIALSLLLLLSLSFALSYQQNGENFTVDGGQLNISILGSPPNVSTNIISLDDGRIKFSHFFNLPDMNYQFVIAIDANSSVHYSNNKTILLNGKYILDYNDVVVNGFAASFVWNQPRGELRLVKNWNAYGIGVGDLVEVDPYIGSPLVTTYLTAGAYYALVNSTGGKHIFFQNALGTLIHGNSSDGGSSFTNHSIAAAILAYPCCAILSNDTLMCMYYKATPGDDLGWARSENGGVSWTQGTAGSAVADNMGAHYSCGVNKIGGTEQFYYVHAKGSIGLADSQIMIWNTTDAGVSWNSKILVSFGSYAVGNLQPMTIVTNNTGGNHLFWYNNTVGYVIDISTSDFFNTVTRTALPTLSSTSFTAATGNESSGNVVHLNYLNLTNNLNYYWNSSTSWGAKPVQVFQSVQNSTNQISKISMDASNNPQIVAILSNTTGLIVAIANTTDGGATFTNKTLVSNPGQETFLSQRTQFYPSFQGLDYLDVVYSRLVSGTDELWYVNHSVAASFSFSNTTAVQANDTDTNYAKVRWRSVTTVAGSSGTCTYGMNSTHTANAISGTTNITNSSGVLETDNDASVAGFSWSCQTGDYNVSWEVPLVLHLSGIVQNTTATSTINVTVINETIGIESNLSLGNISFTYTACPTNYQCDRPLQRANFSAAGTNLLYMNGSGNNSLIKYDFDLNRTNIGNSSVQIQYGNATIYVDNPTTITFTGIQYGLGDFRACGGNWTCGVTGGVGTFSIGANTETTLFMNGSADIIAESNSPVNSTVNISRSYVHESNTTALIHYNLTVNSTTNFSLPAGITWNHTFTGVGHAQSSWANFTLGAFAQSGSRQIAQTEGNISVATARTDYGVIAGFTGTSQNSLYNFTISNFAYTINFASAFDKEFTSNWLYTCTTECPASWGAQWTAIGYDEAISGNLTRQVADGDTGGSIAFMVSSTTGVPAAGGPGGGGGAPFAVFQPLANQTVVAAVGAATAAAEDFGQQITRFLEERIAGIPNYALLMVLFFLLGLTKSYKESARPLPFGITGWGVFFFAMFVFMAIAYSKKIGGLF